jgi:hypothetical protein
MFKKLILSFFMLTSTAVAQPTTKEFKLEIGDYSADLLFIKKSAKVPYDAILFSTSKIAELKVHFDSLNKAISLEKKFLLDACVSETEVLILENHSLQEKYDQLKENCSDESTMKSNMINSLKIQLEVQKQNHIRQKAFLYGLSGFALLSGAAITFFILK